MPDPRRKATPVIDVLVGGFGGSAAGYEDLRKAMEAATGNTTVFVGMTRFGMTCFPGDKRYPRALFRQALHLASRLRKYRGHTFRLFAHSMGGPVAMIVADAYGPVLGITRVVALNSACLYTDGFVPLARRMITKVQNDLYFSRHHPHPHVRRIIRASWLGGLVYLANPVRSLAEAIALARLSLLDAILPRLAASTIDVMVGYTTEDAVFVSDNVASALKVLPGLKSFVIGCGVMHDVQHTPNVTINILCQNGAL